jgi:hypothetical protein
MFSLYFGCTSQQVQPLEASIGQTRWTELAEALNSTVSSNKSGMDRERSGNVQGTFENNQGTFGNIQRAFKEPSGNIQGTFGSIHRTDMSNRAGGGAELFGILK